MASSSSKSSTLISATHYDLRVAYVLCVFEELTAKEAATALDTREGTVWRRVHEARELIRVAITGGSHEP